MRTQAATRQKCRWAVVAPCEVLQQLDDISVLRLRCGTCISMRLCTPSTFLSLSSALCLHHRVSVSAVWQLQLIPPTILQDQHQIPYQIGMDPNRFPAGMYRPVTPEMHPVPSTNYGYYHFPPGVGQGQPRLHTDYHFQDGQTSSPHSVQTQFTSDDSAAHSPHSDIIDLDSLVNANIEKETNTWCFWVRTSRLVQMTMLILSFIVLM
jgi:hypothetical protein